MAAVDSKLRKTAKMMGLGGLPCASSRAITPCHNYHRPHNRNRSSSGNVNRKAVAVEAATAEDANHPQTKQQQQSLCVICLEPLVSYEGRGGRQAIFTAQCMHAFHFSCISSVVHHGGITCPICRSRWAQLPCRQQAAAEPILPTVNSSIANFHSRRRSSLHHTLHNDDDPVEPIPAPAHLRLHMSITSLPTLPSGYTLPTLSPCRHPMLVHHHFLGLSFIPSPQLGAVPQTIQNAVWLSARLSHQQATDIVIVASPSGPHVRLLRQAMALVVFYLRPVDRLAIITCSAATATRALPLRLMTSHGKRMGLQVIDSLFYLGEADPVDGLKKGAKILQDRTYQNPLSCILHLSNRGTIDCANQELRMPFPIHHFNIGYSLGTSNGSILDGFKEFLQRLLRGVIRETQLRIGEEGCPVMLGELRGGEERRIPLCLRGDSRFLRIAYSYIEGGVECPRTGEVVVSIARKIREMAAGGKLGRTWACREGETSRGADTLTLS